MKIRVVLARPTQFDVPFFRHAARDDRHHLRVLYTDPRAAEPAFDQELDRKVDWGGDQLAGYECGVAPASGVREWLRSELQTAADLVVVNGYTQRDFLVANSAARRAGSPTALRLDSVLFDEGSSARRAAKRLTFHLFVRRLFRMFLGVGTSTLEYLRALRVPEDRIGRFPYPVDIAGLGSRASAALAGRATARTELSIPMSARVVLAVAKLHPRETPWDLLQAWKTCGAPDRWLLIVGDGPDRAEVASFVAEHELNNVRLLGYVPYTRLPDYFVLADLFVHAPREERWGVSVAEALACGRPVVASDRVGAARDLIREGLSGFTYPARDAHALAARIGDALGLPQAVVDETARDVLPAWGHEAVWRDLLDAAEMLAHG